MARTNNLTNFLTDVATSIKAKTGDSTAIPASQFDTKIAGITTGKLSNEEYTKANNNLDNILYQSQNVLPDAYQQVEYIQLSGEQYIDTNYALWANTNWKIEYKFDVNEFYNYNNMIGSLETTNSSNEIWITSEGRYYFRFTDVSRTLLRILELNTPYTIIHDNTGTNLLNYVNGELVKTSNKANTSFNYKLGLGHREGAQFLKGKIYYAKFWNGNELVRNFIPCYRKSDEKPGMYDTVNGVFYTNEGTGEFIFRVNENTLPSIYQQVEYLESSGTQYIDTGYIFANPNFKIELKYQKNTSLGTNVFGVDTRSAPRQMHGNIYNRTFYLGNSSVVNNITQELNTDYDYTVIFNENGAYFKLNENEYSYTGTTAWNGASLSDYLFTSHQTEAGGTLYNMKGRIYYARFYNENNVMVRNFIPCYRKLDNEAGMYDTVNNVFYTNDGTGEFSVGADVDVLNTKIESILTEKNTKIIPTNIKKDVDILGVTGTYEGSSGFPPDWSELGYSETPQNILDDFDYSKEIYDNWDSSVTDISYRFNADTTLRYIPIIDTSNATNMRNTFNGCSKIVFFPQLNTSSATNMRNMLANCNSLINVSTFDTSSVTNMRSMFQNCTELVSVPLLNTANVTDISFIFSNCLKLSNESLNNILQMCINATSYTGTKTLQQLGLTSEQSTTCQSLSNYQAFLEAGWTTGY